MTIQAVSRYKSLSPFLFDQAKSIYTNTKISFINTCYRVNDYIKNDFFNFISYTIIIGSYFFVSLEIASNCLITFLIFKAVSKVFYFIFSPIRKINNAPKVKRYITQTHDSFKWLKTYKSKNLSNRKKMLKLIADQTLKDVENLEVKHAFRLSKEEIDKMKQNTQILGSVVKNKHREERYFEIAKEKTTLKEEPFLMKVEVFEGDSYDVAIRLKNERSYEKVVVLNMANPRAGGNFLQGDERQEEALCMRSTLFDSINIHKSNKNNYNPYLKRKMGWWYKIPEFGVIFSPKIRVFRGNVEEGFCYFKNPAELNVISARAYKLNNIRTPKNYRENTKRKIQMIFNSALIKNQELIVLSAFGCGAYNNDPRVVAEIVKEILQERPIYQKKMKIVFAIIRDSADKKGNLKAFSALHNFVK
ncbi:MAG: hypothetical protein K940chlam1_00676 [Candidatus Anoxychlamydiales bacterium]|nr:hypothetical protein [Candidatus Anoxychlamydiales bacterium]NGX36689.1 hypothetical protein [Candidatus Anoxychlamydiales bacterium]